MPSKVINGKLYDTETASLIATYQPIPDRGDFSYICEKLYKTENGRYFVHGRGGPKTPYRKRVGTGEYSGSSEIQPMSTEEALAWCGKRDIDGDIVAEEFRDEIEMA